MYNHYRAYIGQYPGNRDDAIGAIMDGINERSETIVSVTSYGLDNIKLLIITKSDPVIRIATRERPFTKYRQNWEAKIESEETDDDY